MSKPKPPEPMVKMTVNVPQSVKDGIQSLADQCNHGNGITVNQWSATVLIAAVRNQVTSHEAREVEMVDPSGQLTSFRYQTGAPVELSKITENPIAEVFAKGCQPEEPPNEKSAG